MTWTYSGIPDLCLKDAVRFWVQDTDENDPLVQDEEIAYVLMGENNPKIAAALVLESLANKYARQCDKQVGELKLTYQQVAKTMQARATDMRNKAYYEVVLPYAGGISVSDKVANQENTDRVRPFAEMGMTDTVWVWQPHGRTPYDATSTGVGWWWWYGYIY